MGEFLQKCEEYFGSRDFYEILKIDKSASDKQLKKAYHKISLQVHPDRVNENQKLEATEKFKVLGRIHSILQDPDKRKIYDESGEFDEESDSTFNWLDYWRSMFKRISKKDIETYEKEYIGSVTEINDIKKAYIGGKGCMTHILESVPFSNCDSEPRITEIVSKLVKNGEVEEYDGFFNEPEKKKNKRRRKWEQEKKEAEKINIDDHELEMQIQKNHEQREREFGSFLADLETKYGNKKSGNKLKRNAASPPRKKQKTSAFSPPATRTRARSGK